MKSLQLSGSRITYLFSFFILVFTLLIFRLFQIQVFEHKRYESLAYDQYWDLQTLPAKRGDILSSDGYVLASTQIHYLLYAEPKIIPDKYKLAHDLVEAWSPKNSNELSKEATLSSEEFDYESQYKKVIDLLNKDLFWVPLRNGVTPLERISLEKHQFKGIGFEEEPLRYYPEGSLAAHVLGFVASDERGNKIGYYGIEGALNEDLRGKSGRIMEEIDATGNPILVGGYRKIESLPGRNVTLTINRALQYIIEKKIKEGVEKYDAVSGNVIIMDPFTGAVLSMSNFPSYHPGDFRTMEAPLTSFPHRKNMERKNLAISEIYEPGSVIKPLTVAAAIDLGLINPETSFEDTGPVSYSGYTINNWDGKHHNTQNIIQLLQKSNNIGSAWVGHQVGSERLYTYFKNFGLGNKTGIDLEGEDTGVLRDPKNWTDIDLATAAFGQGISATPLQVLTAFNSLVNGGILLKPQIISKIVDMDRVIEVSPQVVRRVISEQTSETMVDLLEKAVEGGEAKYFILKDYRIAGKTGTAQIPEEGKYSADRTNATFVGFLPGSRKFTMIVRLQEPKESVYAAETAVPVWMGIATELVKYYALPADKVSSPEL